MEQYFKPRNSILKSGSELQHWPYLAALVLLVCNDLFLKNLYHNWLTGKLSDFAGLFALPFLFTFMFPQSRKLIHICTAILFIWWKSELSQPFIDLLNSAGLPFHRHADVTDNIALISVLISYSVTQKPIKFNWKPVGQKILITFSLFVFTATSIKRDLKHYVDINKEYSFNFSKRDLVYRLNMLQMKQLQNHYGQVEFNSETSTFHLARQPDTLAMLLDYNKIAAADSLNPGNAYTYKTSYATLEISGNENSSGLKLIKVSRFAPMFSEKDYKEEAIRTFEKRIVKKIRNYR